MLQNQLQHFRHHLAHDNSLLHFSTLGIIAGINCGLIMLAFHALLRFIESQILPGGVADNFEALPVWAYFALPACSGLIIGATIQLFAKHAARTGVPHVLHCLHSKHGHMPLKNMLVQFFMGAFALATGQSGGREGPAVHLGAGINSLLGQKLLLPNNSIRLLIGCGTAAAIAAAFNTPIAGVIFAMEVVMMEYTIVGFIPITLAAISATTVMRALTDTEKLFSIPHIEQIALSSLAELPYVVLLGLLAGCCSAAFIVILKQGLKLSDRPMLVRGLLAGVITGCCALLVPEVLGIGYDSLNAVLASEYTLAIILALLAAKILATAASCGLGLPIGLIGPNLLIGACLGGAVGIGVESLYPELSMQRGFYVLLGMGAVMGAVMNAPLAALMALLELTGNTHIIFPGMLAITVATISHSAVFKQRSATQTVFRRLNTLLRTDPLSLALQRTSVAGIMERRILTSPQLISAISAQSLLDDAERQQCVGLITNSREEGINYYQWQDIKPLLEAAIANQETEIDIYKIAPAFEPAAALHSQATLREALDLMNEQDVNCVHITGPRLVEGLLTRKAINRHASMPQ
ncbi:chloride channel protein [Dasania sp. GY-MA-18]|uniref:Chloride channel protein n=1 Tax=Dasania phycosphaerae TaxID=2950436 RepID=A0A9J6RQU7_9GAMM|nr:MULTISPECIES: chloride channel protein [Dasania]MCR8924395.1 chloride channel protein [Dasania sp. GY-MA-18]MCZ0867070.1 chloride channel protein [Dasania phycosphaerae]MCZ0870522.1 chloride channel protein [Dasania phycosphaerae]